MLKRMFLMLLAMLLLLGGLFGYKYRQGQLQAKAMASQLPPPVTVSAGVAREESWQPALRTTGSLAAVQGVEVSSELAGLVAQITFESGDAVRAGAPLVHLNVETDEAQLRSQAAATELARQTLARARLLRESNVNAQADLDAAQALHDQARASEEMIRTVIARKTIRAPFTGRLGLRRVNLGQYLAAGAAIVSLQSLDPIHLNFALAQQEVGNLAAGQAVELALDAFPGHVFRGTITAFDAGLDPATRTIRVQATLANPDGRLQPGMFGAVAVLLPQRERVITVPQSAVTYNPYGNVIYVIQPGPPPPAGPPPATAAAGPTLVVRQQFVKLGDTRGDQIAILGGLKAGEQIVTGGQLKLRDGVPVRVDNRVPAADHPHPAPPNA